MTPYDFWIPVVHPMLGALSVLAIILAIGIVVLWACLHSIHQALMEQNRILERPCPCHECEVCDAPSVEESASLS